MTNVLAILISVLTVAATPTDKLPDSLNLETVRALTVQHDGRWMPLDTLSRDVVESVLGRSLGRRHDPVLWLLVWTFEPTYWVDQPLITIANAELRKELELPVDRNVFSYTELTRHPRLQALSRELKPDVKLDPLQRKVKKIQEQLATLSEVFLGQTIRLIPDASNTSAAWQTIDKRPPHVSSEVETANTDWNRLQKAFIANDAAAFGNAVAALKSKLDALPAAYRPTPQLIDVELRYNRLHPFRLAWMIMAAGAILAALAALTRYKVLTVLAVVGLLAGFAVMTYGLSLRWTIAGRIPASNMYESLLFLSWGMGLFAIIAMLLIRDRVVPLTASFMGALSLFLAETLPVDHFIRPVAPVLLDTIWMSIHVPVIMVSYSVLALAALIAHTQLVVMAVAGRKQKLIETIDVLHYWYVHIGCILLGAGIATGSMWAASSWGRYWGWDPKEVWSLVAFLAYVAILHRRAAQAKPAKWIYCVGLVLSVLVVGIIALQLKPASSLGILAFIAGAASIPLFAFARGPFATACKSILAFWLIMMTYVGVNFVLGTGLHSYAFGTGAVAHYMFLIGGIDLLLLAACTIVYLIRQTLHPCTIHIVCKSGGST